MHKYSNNKLPLAVSELFLTNDSVHNYNTRNKANLRHPISNREYMYKNFSFQAVYIWNHLKSTPAIDTSASYPKFKNALKEYLSKNELVFRMA